MLLVNINANGQLRMFVKLLPGVVVSETGRRGTEAGLVAIKGGLNYLAELKI